MVSIKKQIKSYFILLFKNNIFFIEFISQDSLTKKPILNKNKSIINHIKNEAILNFTRHIINNKVYNIKSKIIVKNL